MLINELSVLQPCFVLCVCPEDQNWFALLSF